MGVIIDPFTGKPRFTETPKSIGAVVDQATESTPDEQDSDILFVNEGILYKISMGDFIALFNPSVKDVGDVATVEVNCEDYGFVDVAGIAQNFTIANPTGTAVKMQQLLYKIKDDGTARTISYGDQFTSRGILKPTTTIAGKYTTMLFIRNTASTGTWDLIGLDQEPA